MSKITVKKAFNLTEEEFTEMLEKEERLSEEPFVDKALEQFVRKPKEDNLYVEPNYKVSYWAMIILFSIMCIISFIGGILGSMESYVAFPIVLLCLIGIIISGIALKKLY